jgi:hypothetical protein
VFCCTIQDIELSREINDSFRQSAQARLKLPSGIEMNVHVLTTGYVLLGVNYQFVHILFLFQHIESLPRAGLRYQFLLFFMFFPIVT